MNIEKHLKLMFSIFKITKFCVSVISRGAPDTLDEKDCGTDSDNDDDIIASSQPKGNTTQAATQCMAEECDSQGTPQMPQDLEDIIEDFDDED